MSFLKTLNLVVCSAGALFFTACGEKSNGDSEAAEKVTYPDAPEAALKMIATEISKGNTGVLWRALPASYQSDVGEILELASTKLDPELYNQTFTFVGKLADVADKQKNFIFNTELGGERAPEAKAQMEAALPSVIAMVQSIAGSEIGSVEGLKSFDGQIFFDSTVSKLLAHLDTFAELSGESEFELSDLSQLAISVVESEGDQVKLQMTAPNEVTQVKAFTKVENRWVPTEVASQWVESIADGKAKLEAISLEDIEANKPQMLGVLAMLEGVLTQIDSAQTQEQFDQALQGAMMPVMGLIMSLGISEKIAPAPQLPAAP